MSYNFQFAYTVIFRTARGGLGLPCSIKVGRILYNKEGKEKCTYKHCTPFCYF